MRLFFRKLCPRIGLLLVVIGCGESLAPPTHHHHHYHRHSSTPRGMGNVLKAEWEETYKKNPEAESIKKRKERDLPINNYCHWQDRYIAFHRKNTLLLFHAARLLVILHVQQAVHRVERECTFIGRHTEQEREIPCCCCCCCSDPLTSICPKAHNTLWPNRTELVNSPRRSPPAIWSLLC